MYITSMFFPVFCFYLELFFGRILLDETVGYFVQQAPVAVGEVQEALHQHGLGLLPHLQCIKR